MLIFWAVLGGFLLDALFGDPAWLPHPVVLMGRCISALEKQLRKAREPWEYEVVVNQIFTLPMV